jgi:hypothetical protein
MIGYTVVAIDSKTGRIIQGNSRPIDLARAWVIDNDEARVRAWVELLTEPDAAPHPYSDDLITLLSIIDKLRGTAELLRTCPISEILAIASQYPEPDCAQSILDAAAHWLETRNSNPSQAIGVEDAPGIPAGGGHGELGQSHKEVTS